MPLVGMDLERIEMMNRKTACRFNEYDFVKRQLYFCYNRSGFLYIPSS